MARLQYNPNTIIPKDLEGMVKYLQEELDKVSYTFANLPLATTEDGDGGEVIEVYPRHSELEGRAEFEQHPQQAITGLVADQTAQDQAIFRNTKVFFGPDEPPAEESSEGDIWFVEGYD